MNILLIGGGGREHALAWKMNQSELCDDLCIAPGNPGTAKIGTNIDLDSGDFEGIKKQIIDSNIHLVVVGPEQPLADGLKEFLQGDDRLNNVLFAGPGSEGARIESSKAFANAFMERHGIPTAEYRVFTAEDKVEGLKYIGQSEPPFVLKADGLAGGKGVLICQDRERAREEFEEMLSGKFGEAGEKVVIEEFLRGIECSVFAFTDGEDYILLPPSKDYKRIGEGDTGLNTGGMGAVSPVPFVDDALMDLIDKRVVRPTIEGLSKEEIPYCGVLYFGLMITEENHPCVVEYNCRLGDPEAEAVLPLIKSDLVEAFERAAFGTIAQWKARFKRKNFATVVLASGGYPEDYETGKVISGIDEVSEECLVFHSGTRREGNKIVTDGGRVLALTCRGRNHEEALKHCYREADKIEFEGKYLRTDIGFDLQEAGNS